MSLPATEPATEVLDVSAPPMSIASVEAPPVAAHAAVEADADDETVPRPVAPHGRTERDLDAVLEAALRLGAVGPWLRLESTLNDGADGGLAVEIDARITMSDAALSHNPWNEKVAREVRLTRTRAVVSVLRGGNVVLVVVNDGPEDTGHILYRWILGPSVEIRFRIADEDIVGEFRRTAPPALATRATA